MGRFGNPITPASILAMIRRVRFTNFGSLASVDVQLGPLTVLIGPNGSGKSMFLRAMRALALLLRAPTRAATGPLIDQASLDVLVRGADEERTVTFEVWLEDSQAIEPSYRVSLGKLDGTWRIVTEHVDFGGTRFRSEFDELVVRKSDDSVRTLVAPNFPRGASLPVTALRFRSDLTHGQLTTWPVGEPRDCQALVRGAVAVMHAYGRVFVFRPHPGDLLKSAPGSSKGAQARSVSATGAGFALALQQWTQSVQGRRSFEEHVLRTLRLAFPHITDVGFSTDATGEVSLEFGTTHSARAVPAQLESDGVSLTLFLLAAPFLFGASGMSGDADHESLCLAFEEPETGTHPALQGQRLAMLRAVASGAIAGRPVQVIATTHSVDLVRHVAAHEVADVLRVVEMTSGGTVISQIADGADIERLYRLYQGDLGAAWYSGAIGGVPELPPDMPIEFLPADLRSAPQE